MDFISLLGSAWPEGNFWASLMKFFDVGSYALTVILFTVVLKLVLSPIDFLQRFYTNKTTRMQARLQPEMEKLKKRYGQNQTLLYQKQNELYQKNNVSMKGSCTVMLVYMVVTLTVFLTFFNSLQSISGFKINKQYEELQNTYYSSYETNYYSEYLNMTDVDAFKAKTPEEQQEELNALKQALIDGGKTEVEITNYENSVIEQSQIKVVEKYSQIKDSFLWIKNIWRPDSAFVSEIPSFNDFKGVSGNTNVTEAEYNLVMDKLLNNYNNSNQVNGYFILAVIVAAVSFLSQWLTKKLSQPKAKRGEVVVQQPGSAKVLTMILPIIMFIFAMTSNSVFSLYMITNTAITTALTPVITSISNRIEDKKEQQRKEAIKVDYRR